MFTLIPDSDPVLHTETPKFEFDIPELELAALTHDMLTFMRQSNGIGLAAPQIGYPLRLFVMDSVADPTNRRSLVCINPEVISASETLVKGDEGCLSYPDLFLPVRRPISVDVRFQTVQGGLVNETLHDIDARCFCHELDHLNGVTFDELVTPLVLERAMNKLKKGKRLYVRRR